MIRSSLQVRSLCAAALLAVVSPAFAQPESVPPKPPRERGGGVPPSEGEGVGGPRMRRFIEMRLQRQEEERRQLSEALEMLDRGESPDKVREHLRGVLRDRAEGAPDVFPREPGAMRPPPRPRGSEGPGMGPRGGDRPGEGPPREPMQGPGGPPSLDRMMDVLSETNPRMFERLSRLRRDDPEEFKRVLQDFAPRLGRLAEERERFPERWPDRARLLRLQPLTIQAAREAALLPESERAEAVERLRSLLNEQFDIRLAFAKDDLERHDRQRERLVKEIEESAKNRGAMIERRAREMIEHELDRE